MQLDKETIFGHSYRATTKNEKDTQNEITRSPKRMHTGDCIGIDRKTYTAMTGSTSHVSGTSRFIVKVLDSGIFAKNAFGPFTA